MFERKVYQKIMKTFREYMLVGGMPQIVDAYLQGKDLGKANFVKQQILNLYRQDMGEQEEENPEYVTNFFDRIPSELSNGNSLIIVRQKTSNLSDKASHLN